MSRLPMIPSKSVGSLLEGLLQKKMWSRESLLNRLLGGGLGEQLGLFGQELKDSEVAEVLLPHQRSWLGRKGPVESELVTDATAPLLGMAQKIHGGFTTHPSLSVKEAVAKSRTAKKTTDLNHPSVQHWIETRPDASPDSWDFRQWFLSHPGLSPYVESRIGNKSGKEFLVLTREGRKNPKVKALWDNTSKLGPGRGRVLTESDLENVSGMRIGQENEAEVGMDDSEPPYYHGKIEGYSKPFYPKTPHRSPKINAMRKEANLRAQGKTGTASLSNDQKDPRGPLGLLLDMGDAKEKSLAPAISALDSKDYGTFMKLANVAPGERWSPRAADARLMGTETFQTLLDHISDLDPKIVKELPSRWPTLFNSWKGRLKSQLETNQKGLFWPGVHSKKAVRLAAKNPLVSRAHQKLAGVKQAPEPNPNVVSALEAKLARLLHGPDGPDFREPPTDRRMMERQALLPFEDSEIDRVLGNLPLRDSMRALVNRAPHKAYLLDMLRRHQSKP